MLPRTSAAICLAAVLAASCRPSPPKLPAPDVPAARVPPATGSPALDRLRRTVLAATALPGVRRATWGIAVQSLHHDERLVELNPTALLTPASAAKIFPAAAASEAVGWAYSYETVLRATGPIVNGVLQGDLVAVGSGDPTIEGRIGQGFQPWIAAVRAAGIRRVQGRVIGDDDRLEEPRPPMAWAWDDIGFPTGILFGALNAHENRMTVTVAPAATAGAPAVATVERHAMSRPFVSRVTTGPPASQEVVWPEQRPGDPYLTLVGSIPLRAKPALVLASAGNPTLWFATVLRDRLQQAGIDVQGEAMDIDDARPAPARTGTTLYVHRSPPLSAILQPMLKNSVNLYAEAVLRLNAPRGGPATMDAALDGLRRRLASWGIAIDAQQLVDGSGVSRRSVVSADAMCAVLKRMHAPAAGSPFVQALPLAGVDGTLLERMRGTAAAGNARGKTGTMSNVRALAGYVTTRDGEPLAFAIIANNFEGGGDAATQAIDAMVVALAGFRRDSAAPARNTTH
jgi:D-alanyl-D-alanine carboxypeptidase/D-alanyl-D-alanine-endopeptidase (penicillin-binding protein 4)